MSRKHLIDKYDHDMVKWMFRQNARRNMEFGVHEAASLAFSKNGGESWPRFNSTASACCMVRDNIECLRRMQSPEFAAYMAKTRSELLAYYTIYGKRRKAAA